MELVQVLALDHPAEASPDGVDEHDVRRVEDRVRVVLEARGRPLLEPLVVVGHAPRPRVPEVHPHRRGPRPAVEREDQRPGARIGHAVLRVRDVAHLRDDLALVSNRNPADLGGVVDALAVEPPRVLRHDGLGRQEVGLLAGLGRRRRGRRRRELPGGRRLRRNA